jgi:phage FluMu gp28-like protein
MKLRPIVDAVKGAATAVALGAALATAPVAAVDPLDQLVTSAARADSPPPVLLGYQQRWVADESQLKVAEKGRRVGLTWAEASDNVLIASAAGGSNVFYISATQDMAREYIEACSMWARVFNFAAGLIGEGLYEDGDDAQGNRKFIKTYEISFPQSGHRIVALSSRPTNLRGKQGVVVIDEAAFAQDLAGLLKAAMAMLMWGDKVRIISTHDGVENAFNTLIQEIRAGKRGKATVHRITFANAVADGLYRRVCMRKGIEWTQAGEDEWVASARAFYGDDAAEELDVVPSQSAGAYLSLALIQQRMAPVTDRFGDGPWVVRGKWDDAFAYWPEATRRASILAWCDEELLPLLLKLHPERRHIFSQDFARNRDQSIMGVQEEDNDLTHRQRLTVELHNCPFSSQLQILEYIVDVLPGFRGGAMDATGNGAALAEAAAQKYGVEMIEQVKLNDSFYLAHMPKLKAALQDGTYRDMPRDPLVQDDMRAIKMINGIPKVPQQVALSAAAKAAAAEGGSKGRRHGDFAVMAFLGIYAWSRQVGEIDWTTVDDSASTFHERAESLNRTLRMRDEDGPSGADSRGGWD